MRHVSEKAETKSSGEGLSTDPSGLSDRGKRKSSAAGCTYPRGFWPSPGAKILVPLSDPTSEGNIVMKKKIDIAAIPELNTSVGLNGSLRQKEVGGPLCLGVFVAIMIAL